MREVRHKKKENLDNYFTMARATEEKFQQMAGIVEKVDNEREKFIMKDMEEMKKRFETVNDKIWSLETRMDKMNRDQTENSCAIQSKLDALLRNKKVAEKTVRQPGIRWEFAEPRRKKQESTPFHQIHNNIGSETGKLAVEKDIQEIKRV